VSEIKSSADAGSGMLAFPSPLPAPPAPKAFRQMT
jgi:hypothetical protein